jgi:hypothetical protein
MKSPERQIKIKLCGWPTSDSALECWALFLCTASDKDRWQAILFFQQSWAVGLASDAQV